MSNHGYVVALRKTLLLAAYYYAANFAFRLETVGGFACPVWLPSGIALCALIVWGTEMWPAIFCGALLVNYQEGAHPLVAGVIGCGNSLEAIVAHYLLRRLGDFENVLKKLSGVLGFIFGATFFSSLMGSTIGVGSLWLSGTISANDFGLAWLTWWLGDSMGILVVVPLLFSWRHPLSTRIEPQRALEILGLGLVILVVNGVIFLDWGVGEGWENFLQPYFLFPVSLWAASRFGHRGATAITTVAVPIAIWGTSHGYGYFVKLQTVNSLVSLQMFIIVLSLTGLIVSVVVTERKRMERERSLWLDDLQKAVKTRDEFMSLASHELRTPLTALGFEIEILYRMLNSAFPRGLNEEMGEIILGIKRQVQRFGHLIENMLDMSRFSSGRLDFEQKSVDLSALIADVVRRHEAEAKLANCPISLRAEKWVRGYWDPLRLDQVATNLLSNAFKYGSGKPIEVEVKRESGQAQLVVRDHGIGIPTQDQNRIFERFERAVESRHYGGMGLGLWISKTIVEAQGGTISVSSLPGEGATFVVSLPAYA